MTDFSNPRRPLPHALASAHVRLLGCAQARPLGWCLLIFTLLMGVQTVKAQTSSPFQPQPLSAQPLQITASAALNNQPDQRLAASASDRLDKHIPVLPLSAMPRSARLSYRLSGVEKGIHYQATSQLHWQHNASDYAMNLSLKVFLLGTKNWQSQGQITSAGLAPAHFKDIWRKERAVFFDRSAQRLVFDHHAASSPLQPGAQDQVSLYAQLAAVMAHSGQSWPPGSRLQIQTATVREALPWSLTLEKMETLPLDGQNLPTTKWVAQRQHRDDSRVEFWVSAALDWLPARIRISQAGGSVIDLQLTGREGLPDLPASAVGAAQATKSSHASRVTP